MTISKLQITYIGTENDYKQYKLKTPLIVSEHQKEIISVPSGFKTDLASIPRPLNKWIKRNNVKYARSVIIHDYLYEIKAGKFYADKMLYKCMKVEGVGLRYRIPFFIAVSLFGWFNYYD